MQSGFMKLGHRRVQKTGCRAPAPGALAGGAWGLVMVVLPELLIS